MLLPLDRMRQIFTHSEKATEKKHRESLAVRRGPRFHRRQQKDFPNSMANGIGTSTWFSETLTLRAQVPLESLLKHKKQGY